MQTKSLSSCLLVASVLFTAVQAAAHHSGAEYDRTKPITVQATVTEFHFSNPHPQLYMDVKDENGNIVHWGIEIGPNPARLVPIGWGKKRSEAALAPGSAITITVSPSKINAHFGVAMKIVTANGEEVFGARAGQAN